MAKVYFTENINGESLVKIYNCLEKQLQGKIGIKISTGEVGGHNFLAPSLIKDLVWMLKATILECNTAYKGKRYRTEDHLKAAKMHGFTDIAQVDIMDSIKELAIPVKNGFHLKENFVGDNLKNYDSLLILSHFKGHQMGGFGGALKNMSIGIASREGKAWIHTAGKTKDPKQLWNHLPAQEAFLEAMADADKSVIDYMHGNIVYINVVNNLSIDCDCNGNPKDPCMADIGILASIDPVALDKACVDLIYNSSDPGKKRLIARIEKMNGVHILSASEQLGIGGQKYELINIDCE